MEPSSGTKKVSRKYPTPRSAKGYEDNCIALAYNLAEERLRNGTAKSAEIVYFLQKGSPVEKLKAERAQKEVELMQAKIDAIKNQERMDIAYEEALKAISSYRGSIFNDTEEEEEDEYED